MVQYGSFDNINPRCNSATILLKGSNPVGEVGWLDALDEKKWTAEHKIKMKDYTDGYKITSTIILGADLEPEDRMGACFKAYSTPRVGSYPSGIDRNAICH